jgi:hypothetical protein
MQIDPNEIRAWHSINYPVETNPRRNTIGARDFIANPETGGREKEEVQNFQCVGCQAKFGTLDEIIAHQELCLPQKIETEQARLSRLCGCGYVHTPSERCGRF